MFYLSVYGCLFYIIGSHEYWMKNYSYYTTVMYKHAKLRYGNSDRSLRHLLTPCMPAAKRLCFITV